MIPSRDDILLLISVSFPPYAAHHLPQTRVRSAASLEGEGHRRAVWEVKVSAIPRSPDTVFRRDCYAAPPGPGHGISVVLAHWLCTVVNRASVGVRAVAGAAPSDVEVVLWRQAIMAASLPAWQCVKFSRRSHGMGALETRGQIFAHRPFRWEQCDAGLPEAEWKPRRLPHARACPGDLPEMLPQTRACSPGQPGAQQPHPGSSAVVPITT